MIHTFSVSNYGSIRDEVTLDLRIPGTAPDLARFRRSVACPDVRLPTVAVLMGPNGSGKSTLLRALGDLGRFVSHRSELEKCVWMEPFMSDCTRWNPTRFTIEGEADFIEPGETPRRFRYELEVGRERTGVEVEQRLFVSSETLVHYPRGRRRRLLERQGVSTPPYVSRDLGLTARDPRLKAIGPHQSAFATLGFLNVPVAKRFMDFMTSWVTTNVAVGARWRPDTNRLADWLEQDPASREWVRLQLQRSDLGITDIDVDRGLPGSQILCHHRGLDDRVFLELESRGTRTMLDMLPLIRVALQRGTLAVLDEVDGDLHVEAVEEMLDLFRSPESNPHNAQLLMTSHHVGLLDTLEKEEVFIVEKDDDGGTRLHGAQDVKGLRRDVRLYNKYRAGVLGGIPRLG